MMVCSVPSLFKAWFDRYFLPECQWHDDRYVNRDLPKIVADLGVSWKMATKYKWSFVFICAFVVLAVLPKAYGMWYRDEMGRWIW